MDTCVAEGLAPNPRDCRETSPGNSGRERTFAESWEAGRKLSMELNVDPQFNGSWRCTVDELYRELPALRRMARYQLRAFQLGQRHPHLLAFGDLTLSHLLVVSSLDQPTQTNLLTMARDKRLTVRQFSADVSRTCAAPASTGRPRSAGVLKLLKGALSLPSAFEGVESLLATTPHDATKLLAVCIRAHTELARVEEALRTAAARKRTRILLVDRDERFARRARRLLSRDSYLVSTAHSSAEALSRRDHRIECAVINVALENGSGVTLSQRLTGQRPNLQVVLFTSSADPIKSVPSSLGGQLVRVGSALTELRRAIANKLLRPLRVEGG